MGKPNRSLRTKGNTRPSSSGHSAQLLSTAGLPPSPHGFIGFQNYCEETSGRKQVEVSKDVCKGCPEAFTRTILKKMLKRDAVTRLKAVQEFIDVCFEDNYSLRSVLPYWPRLFNKLALDPDKRVRELIHVANEQLVTKVKRDVAPYLKSFMGIWLITQCDVYVPAASAAQRAFSSAFPPQKQAEALMFCRSEIIKLIRENLFSLQPENAGEPNALTEDESAEKYQLVLICTLSGMKLFVSILPQDDRDKILDDVVLILGEQSFWNYSTSKASQVRRAWYRLVTSLCHDMPAVFLDTKRKLILSAMGNLSESDPFVGPAIWECALQITTSFEDWWHHIDVIKQVLPPLWKFLKQGGMGNAVSIFPCLLPFLSRLPKEVTGTGIHFYKEFFSCIRASFLHSGLKVPSECNAVIKGFMECLQYSVDLMFRNPECDENVVEHLITEQLLPLVKSSLKPEESHVAASLFYPLLGQYLQYIEAQALIERNVGNFIQYNNFLTVFWKDVYFELINILNMEHTQHDKELATLTFFFHSLHRPSKYISAKKKRVKFDDENVNSDVNEIDTTSSDVSYQNASASHECSFLFENTVKICAFLCHKLEDNLCCCCIELFSEIISAVSSSKLYFDLLTVLHVPVQEITAAPFAFFQVVLKWAKQTSFCDNSLDSIAGIIHSICSCVSLHSALDLLDTCAKVECQKLFCRLIFRALDSKESSKLFKKWFQTPVFCTTLKVMMVRLIEQLSIAKINISSQIPVYREAILKCIGEACSEEPKIPRKIIGTVLDICLASLSYPTNFNEESLQAYTFVDLMCDICEKLNQYSVESWKFRCLDSFVFRLFVLSLDREKYNLSDKLQKRLCGVWQVSIGSLAQSEIELRENSFLFLVCDHLHNLLQVPLSNEMHTHVGMIMFDFLVEVQEAFCDKFIEPYGSVLSLMIEKILPTSDEWNDLREGLKLNTLPYILKGKWFYPDVSEDCSSVWPIVLPQLIVVAEITSHMLYKVLEWYKMCNRNKPDEVFRKQLVKNFPHFLWSWCYIESMGYCRFQTEKELPVVRNLEKNIKELAAFLQASDIRELANNLFDRSLSDGLTWAIPFENLKKLESPLFIEEIRTCMGLFTKRIQKITALSESLTLQVCLRNAPCQRSTEFLESRPFNFFDIAISVPSERDSFEVLSEVSCSIQALPVEGLRDSQDWILCLLHDLVNYNRKFGCDEGDGPRFVVNFATVSSIVLREVPDILSCDLWCSIFDVVIDCFEHCTKMGGKVLKSSPMMVFMHQTFSLICIISHLFRTRKPDEEVEEYLLPVNAKWHQLFNDVISSRLLKLYLQIAEFVQVSNQLSEAAEMLMNVLSQAIEYLSTEQLMMTLLPIEYERPGDVCFDVKLDRVYGLLHQLASFLMSKSLSLQFGIHFILSRIVVVVPQLLESRNKVDDDDVDENSFKSFPLVVVLQSINGLVETMLAEVKLGEYYILKPNTNSYIYTIGYLLTWTELLEYFSASFSEERSVCAYFLEENQLLSSLLVNLVRLLPGNPPLCSVHVPPKTTVKRHDCSIFKCPLPISSLETPSHYHLQHVACNLYYNTLRKVPALVRTWWTNLDKKSADVVERLTSKYISGLLSSMEIRVIQAGNVKFNNMTIKARPASREVVATYAVDDSTIELFIQLPSNYPLGPIVADCRRKMGIGQAQWRNWLLQLTTFLNFHNGSIVDALALWKKNLDKKFEGVEECMICYFILHSSSCKLPSLSCSTCRKKFHSSCLYKWFSTSNNSTCPSCRNYF